MKRLFLLPALLLCSCGTMASGTRVDVRSNCAYLEWHGGTKPSLIMTNVDNGTPTRASGALIGTTGASLTALLMAWLSHGVVR